MRNHMEIFMMIAHHLYWAPAVVGSILFIRGMRCGDLVKEHYIVLLASSIGGLGISVLYLSWAFVVLIPFGMLISVACIPLTLLGLIFCFLPVRIEEAKRVRSSWSFLGLGWLAAGICYLMLYAGIGAVAS
ncbi:hypothetical protein CCB80_03650 [Armatimonadetes bacterium Uphvl-Ar1]|nr:hypothetical protein CCB80_03650 [Armatimonadetes bacterium Uphvl-Ar1]